METFCSVYFTNAVTGYIVGWGGTILKTSDGGSYWKPLNSGKTVSLLSVYFPCTDTGYVVGERGLVLKTTNGGYPFGVNDLLSNSTHLKIYPIPSFDKITIQTSDPQASDQLSILNLKGQELIHQTIIKPSTQIDISNLPIDVYFVRLTNDKTVEVGKFIKQ
jgi:hypothetical protein